MSHPTLLTAYLASASLGLGSGALSLAFAGHTARQRAAGNLFFASMLALSACGAWLAWFKAGSGSIVANGLGFYLFATAWLAARRERGGTLDLLAMALALSVGIAAVAGGLAAGRHPAAGGFHAALYFLLGGIALFACGLDAQTYRGGLPVARRADRRLWRGGTALALCVTLFCLDQGLLPEHWRGSLLPILPILLALAVLVWWLNRTPRGGAPVGRRKARGNSAPRHALHLPHLA